MKLNREIFEMKLKIFFSVVICSAMFLPSIDSQRLYQDNYGRFYYRDAYNRLQPYNANQWQNSNGNQGQNTNVNQQQRPNINEQQRPNVNQQQRPNVNQELRPNVNQQQPPNTNRELHPHVNRELRPNVNEQNQPRVNQEPKQSNQLQNLYCGYTIAAMIDDKLINVARELEKYIKQAPSFRKSFSPTAASNYHSTLYSIYQCQSIPPQQCVYDKCWIPDTSYEAQNNWATCYIESNLHQPLHIKYASLNIGPDSITLKLDMEDDSWNRIRYGRIAWENAYYGKTLSSDAQNKLLNIEIAKGKRGVVTINDLNRLNELVRPFNGGKLKIPSVYLRGSRYAPYQKKSGCKM